MAKGRPSSKISEAGLRELAVRLARLRGFRLLTQREVSKLSGVHRTVIQRTESGSHEPTLSILVALATTYGVDTATLLKGIT